MVRSWGTKRYGGSEVRYGEVGYGEEVQRWGTYAGTGGGMVRATVPQSNSLPLLVVEV